MRVERRGLDEIELSNKASFGTAHMLTNFINWGSKGSIFENWTRTCSFSWPLTPREVTAPWAENANVLILTGDTRRSGLCRK